MLVGGNKHNYHKCHNYHNLECIFQNPLFSKDMTGNRVIFNYVNYGYEVNYAYISLSYLNPPFFISQRYTIQLENDRL